jgi:hypothetical protein
MTHFYLKPLLSMPLGSEDLHVPTISHHSTSVDLSAPAMIFKDLHCKGSTNKPLQLTLNNLRMN